MTTTPTDVLTVLDPPVPRRPARAFGRRIRYGLGVLPVAVADLAAVATGRPDVAVRRQRRRAARWLGADAGSVPVASTRVAVHAGLSAVLGLLFWWQAFIAVTGVARGPFYPLADPGPYDHSWGGPNMVGAWAAHAWVWAFTLPVAVALWWGLSALHGRLTARLLGSERRRWVLPVTAVVVLAALVFLRAWAHQL